MCPIYGQTVNGQISQKYPILVYGKTVNDR